VPERTDDGVRWGEPVEVQGAQVAALQVAAGGDAHAVVHVPHPELALAKVHEDLMALAAGRELKIAIHTNTTQHYSWPPT
jgi:hypothetical protein